MKKILILILIIGLFSCTEVQYTYYTATKTSVRILNKKIFKKEYYIQIYVDESAIWYEVNKNVFDSYKINDVYETLVLTNFKYERTVSDSIKQRDISNSSAAISAP